MDILEIEGIGQEYEKKLSASGIDTVEELLKRGSTPEGRKEIADTTEISSNLILKWVYLADLIRIKGVGEEYSELLQVAGINRTLELSQQDAKKLFKKIVEINDIKKLVRQIPTLLMVRDWIRQAKKLPTLVIPDEIKTKTESALQKRPLSIILVSIFSFLFALTLLITSLVGEESFLTSLSMTLIIFCPLALVISFILIFINRKKDKTRTRAFTASTFGALVLLIFSSVMFSQTFNPINTANNYFGEKRYEEAITYYQQVLDKSKNSNEIKIANLKIEEAKTFINNASECMDSGNNYIADGLYELALVEYMEGYEIYPYLSGIGQKIEDVKKIILETPKNSPPIAVAGEDIECHKGEDVRLSGSGSGDPENDKLIFKWEIDGQEYEGENLTISIDKSGTYSAILTVSDGELASEDTVRITVNDEIVMDEAPEIEEEGSSTWTARCVRVIDGDTIELENGDRVRYIGINCPESDEELGNIATEINRGLVLGKEVTLEKDVSDTDRYGRILAYVYVDDLFINAYLVENGYAQVATYPPDVKYTDHFLDLQQKAVEEGNGFWAETEEEPPQEEQQATYGINIVSLTSPINRGSQASITINTAPNVSCNITVYYKSGASEAQGLEPKNSDGSGNCTWSWKVGTRTTPGNWRIVIKADGVEQAETTFTVTE